MPERASGARCAGGRCVGGFGAILDLRRWSIPLGVAVVVGVVPGVWAGTVIGVKTVYFVERRAEETATIYLDKDRVRFDALEDGRPTTLIFRVDENGEPLCWVIDKTSKTYAEITGADAERIQAEGARARERLDERMENSPPEQREKMKRAMDASRLAIAGQLVGVRFDEVARGVRLDKWTCTQYEAYVGDQKQEDLWTADEETLGLRASEVEALRQMGLLFSKFSTQTNAFFQIGRTDEGGFRGFPVIVVEYENGRKRERSEVTSVRREKLDPAVFDLPTGVRRQSSVYSPR